MRALGTLTGGAVQAPSHCPVDNSCLPGQRQGYCRSSAWPDRTGTSNLGRGPVSPTAGRQDPMTSNNPAVLRKLLTNATRMEAVAVNDRNRAKVRAARKLQRHLRRHLLVAVRAVA